MKKVLSNTNTTPVTTEFDDLSLFGWGEMDVEQRRYTRREHPVRLLKSETPSRTGGKTVKYLLSTTRELGRQLGWTHGLKLNAYAKGDHFLLRPMHPAGNITCRLTASGGITIQAAAFSVQVRAKTNGAEWYDAKVIDYNGSKCLEFWPAEDAGKEA